MTDETIDAELQRLREHDKQLLAELKAAKTDLKASKEALQAAEAARDAWRSRWYKVEVEAPLEADLRSSAAGPWKYLRDTLLDRGILKMQADDEGVARPQWFDEKGKPADLAKGLHHFLGEIYLRTKDADIGSCVRGIGASGGGAQQSASAPATHERSSTDGREQSPTQFGLR